VSVLIKEIDPDKRRISLSLREAQGDPWLEVSEKFSVGQAVSGTVEKKERFGIFVNLAPGITGLFPKSKISQAADSASIERLRQGDPITVTVEEIDLTGRRITLSGGDAGDADNWQKYSAGDPGGGLGTLGEQLQQALAKRKD
jgi:small subunit ribosomal protein S1